MNKIVLAFCIFFVSLACAGQNLDYARKVVKTLASEEFKGRGYVGKGDKKAAEFIRKEFEKFGLKPVGKSYYQKFTTPVNTFPAKMDLTLNDVKQEPGVDFLIDPYSPGINGTFEVVTIAIDEILDGQKLAFRLSNSIEKFIVIPAYSKVDYSKDEQKQISQVIDFLKYHPDNPAAGTIILTNEKLNWSVSTVTYPRPTILVKSDSALQAISTISVNIDNRYFEKYKSQNVIGFVAGQNPDSSVVITAHYDHLGMMGSNTLFLGANDNASGVAMLLNLAKYYSAGLPKYNIIFMALGGEELGLVGARYFIEHPLFELSVIRFLLNFDISGTGDDGIQVVNGSVYREEFDRLSRINEENNFLSQVKIRGEACNSDHCMFYMKKVPCFYIYTLGGIQAYHDINDKAETLPLTEFEDYFALMTRFIDEM